MPERVDLTGDRGHRALGGNRSSATTMIGEYINRNRCSTSVQILSMSNGCSGIKMMFAPPASPECSAIQPACLPITSTTSTR